MTDELMKDILKRNIGEDRYNQICSEFQLSPDAQTLLENIMAEWTPSLSFPRIIESVKKHESNPHVPNVYAALLRMTQELESARRDTFGSSNQ